MGKICVAILLPLVGIPCAVLLDILDESRTLWDDVAMATKLGDGSGNEGLCRGKGGDCPKPQRTAIENFILQRQPSDITNTVQVDLPAEKREKSSLLHLGHQFSCSCGTEYRLLDLGYSYYPRYLPTAVCQPATCWGGSYRCRPKHYAVRVLKTKSPEGNEEEGGAVSVPRNLKDSWTAETVTVTVGCHCGP